MIDDASLSPQWLEEKRWGYKKDPGIIEAMIHALYLVDKLKITGLDFIFKAQKCCSVFSHKKGFPLQSLTQQPAKKDVLFKPRRQGFLLALPKRNKRLGVFPLREPESRLSCRIRI